MHLSKVSYASFSYTSHICLTIHMDILSKNTIVGITSVKTDNIESRQFPSDDPWVIGCYFCPQRKWKKYGKYFIRKLTNKAKPNCN